jgi:hypothetical protein
VGNIGPQVVGRTMYSSTLYRCVVPCNLIGALKYQDTSSKEAYTRFADSPVKVKGMMLLVHHLQA